MGAGVGVEQQLVGVEAVPRLRLVGAVNAVAVELPRLDAFDVAVEHLVGVFRQLDAGDLLLARAVEQAHFHLLGIGGKQREIGPLAVPLGAARIRQAFAQFVVAHVNAPRPAPMLRCGAAA